MRLEVAPGRTYVVRMPTVSTQGLYRAAVGILACVLLGLYLFSAFGLSENADILRFNSSIFDMDVGRIVNDWTTNGGGRRTHVHPLSKLAVAPIGTALRFSGGLSGVDAARWIAVVAMTLYALLAGRLATQLARGEPAPGLLATLVCGASFSCLLLASIPDTASVSGISTLVPLLYLNRRWGKRFTWGEGLVWSAIGLLSVAFTISQIVHWVIALGLRTAPDFGTPRRADRALGRRRALVLAPVVLLGAATWGAANLQESLYPGTGRFYERRSPIDELRSFQRLESLSGTPVRHSFRLANHFVGVNYVAPFPGYSDFAIERWRQPYWSLSLEESRLEAWHPAQIALFGLWLLCLIPALFCLRRADRRFLAPLLCIASQFLMHLVYGREYILYSSNWHGAVTAVLVAAVWNERGSARRWIPPLALALSLGLAANSLTVMQRVYSEVKVGLGQSGRDAIGRPLAPAPGLLESPIRP
ncbi:MAG: hypothetical protein V3T07_02860 [Myxococcota bacterium]